MRNADRSTSYITYIQKNEKLKNYEFLRILKFVKCAFSIYGNNVLLACKNQQKHPKVSTRCNTWYAI